MRLYQTLPQSAEYHVILGVCHICSAVTTSRSKYKSSDPFPANPTFVYHANIVHWRRHILHLTYTTLLAPGLGFAEHQSIPLSSSALLQPTQPIQPAPPVLPNDQISSSIPTGVQPIQPAVPLLPAGAGFTFSGPNTKSVSPEMLYYAPASHVATSPGVAPMKPAQSQQVLTMTT